jgi:hypothetical protein
MPWRGKPCVPAKRPTILSAHERLARDASPTLRSTRCSWSRTSAELRSDDEVPTALTLLRSPRARAPSPGFRRYSARTLGCQGVFRTATAASGRHATAESAAAREA